MEYYIQHYDNNMTMWVIDHISYTKEDAIACRDKYFPNSTIQEV